MSNPPTLILPYTIITSPDDREPLKIVVVKERDKDSSNTLFCVEARTPHSDLQELLTARDPGCAEQEQALNSLGVGTFTAAEGSSLNAGTFQATSTYKGLSLEVRTSRSLRTFTVTLIVKGRHIGDGQFNHGLILNSDPISVDDRMLGSVVGALLKMNILNLCDALGVSDDDI